MDNSNTASGGMGLGTILTIIFVILKLCGVIGWSWVWVLSPLWISFALGFGLLLIILLVGSIAAVLSKR